MSDICNYEYTIIEKLYSKKNDVYKIINPTRRKSKFSVLKIFRSPGSRKRKKIEAEILGILNEDKIAAPEIQEEGDDFIIMEHIDGKTLLEMLEEAEENIEKNNNIESEKSANIPEEKLSNLIFGVYDFLLQFRQTIKKKKGIVYNLNDMNLRNFIIGEKLYRVDFEECSPILQASLGEDPEKSSGKDLGKFFAFILAYNPPFSIFKTALVRKSINKLGSDFNINKDNLNLKIKQELAEIEVRRNINLHPYYPYYF